ncbi:hypothetical protein [Gloeocapsopsis sp. IPPAS B-1203]|uniref:hypothetical protein n=1 Tax=Gloeocapsopsis sp. IPPAS B-1203 TaxID=2049454 RepID=UPI000C17ACA9|nr:hypothetical protein [Gloeocapsopsis sp. IPPAS B-1203]PIG94095.1 hypothetical protein CSQ79_07075 [Gloeocapsopsis sp. IPPAS B-1203]
MISTFFLYLIAISYLFSGLISWLAFVKNISHRASFSCWQNIFVLLASLIVLVTWPIWIIAEAKKVDIEEIMPGVTSST